jgi:hypothetical protein
MATSRPLSGSDPATTASPRRLDGIRALLTSKAFFPVLAVVIFGYYALLVTDFHRLTLWSPAIEPGESADHTTLGFVFNDMLLRLLHWDFTIGPETIKYEAVFWGDKIYAYFGVMPALIRVLFLPFFDLTRTDVSPLCVTIAATLSVLFKVAALRSVLSKRATTGASATLAWALLAILILGGAPIQFLKTTIYQETVFWEGVFGSAFLALAVAGLTGEAGFSSRRLQLMAFAAGCCLLTRVVLASGLYIALLLLLALLFVSEGRNGSVAAPRSWSRFLFPVAILVVFAGLAGLVNCKRFDNPFVFHMPRETLYVYPDGVPGLDDYGEFNPLRIPYGLMYYFAPVWFLHGGDGGFLFHSFKERVMDLVELPPSSFLISDALLLALAIGGAASILRNRPLTIDRGTAGAIACGLALPPLFMLTAYAMAHRYRMEFYPLLEFLALIGGFAAVGPALRWQRKSGPVIALAIISIVASHVVLVAYKVSSGGSPDPSRDVPVSYYRVFKKLIFRH